MRLKTHLKIDPDFSGRLVKLKEGFAEVELETKDFMAADERGLVHGGFTFSAADFAAMAAINEEFVVLTGAEVKFLAPVVVGQRVLFRASVLKKEGPKADVAVEGFVEEKKVFGGTFHTYTPKKHILDKA